MKNKLVLIMSIVMIPVILSGCGTSSNSNNSESKDTKLYEYHLDISTYGYKEDYIFKYDSKGKFLSLDYAKTYTYEKDKYCDITDFNKVDISGVISSCKYKNKKPKIHINVTKEGIENGALKNNTLKEEKIDKIYEKVSNETKIIEYLKKEKEANKKHNIYCDDKNYMIMNGKKTCW